MTAEKKSPSTQGLGRLIYSVQLRDIFAGLIAAGAVASSGGQADPKALAIYSYRRADALLEEREKSSDTADGLEKLQTEESTP